MKTLLRIRDARERLRDVAAARSAAGEREVTDRRADLETATDDLVTAERQACDRLRDVSTLQDLEDATGEVLLVREDIVQAEQRVRAAEQAAAAELTRLRRRTRELRGVERLVETTRLDRQKVSDAGEQRLSDDISSHRPNGAREGV